MAPEPCSDRSDVVPNETTLDDHIARDVEIRHPDWLAAAARVFFREPEVRSHTYYDLATPGRLVSDTAL